MEQELRDLKTQIEIKKSILKSECNEQNCPNKEFVKRTKYELDFLLYRYYKAYKCCLCVKNHQKND